MAVRRSPRPHCHCFSPIRKKNGRAQKEWKGRKSGKSTAHPKIILQLAEMLARTSTDKRSLVRRVVSNLRKVGLLHGAAEFNALIFNGCTSVHPYNLDDNLIFCNTFLLFAILQRPIPQKSTTQTMKRHQRISTTEHLRCSVRTVQRGGSLCSGL